MVSNHKTYDALALSTMASGHLCLNLSETVTWEGFPAYANAFLKAVGGKRRRVVAETVDAQLWEVMIDGQYLSLVFDDFPVMVSLESGDALGDAVLRKVHGVLSGSC